MREIEQKVNIQYRYSYAFPVMLLLLILTFCELRKFMVDWTDPK